MLTTEKIKTYLKYGGDIDGYIRFNRDIPNRLFDKEDWSIIDILISDIYLINQGLASEQFVKEAEKRIKDNCDSGEVILLLKEASRIINDKK